MKLAAAARRLKLAISTVRLLVKRGDLDIDLETDSSGARFIPRRRSSGTGSPAVAPFGTTVNR